MKHEPIQSMNHELIALPGTGRYELRYRLLINNGRGFAFPCDAQGRIVVDALSERARGNYLRACAAVGRDLGWPVVQRLA